MKRPATGSSLRLIGNRRCRNRRWASNSTSSSVAGRKRRGKNNVTLQASTSQTVGPFFEIGLSRLYANDLTGPGVSGERVEIQGKVFDGDGQSVPDAMIEIWQANAHG